MKNVRKIAPTIPVAPVRKKVAAYARVSMETDRMMHSLSTQVSYYSELIQKNPEWQYVGVYADNFISGTSTGKRTEFQRMVADCEAGKIDIVLTKSISRFARNTVDLLETVRHLKELGIEVRFEKERINSLSEDGELSVIVPADQQSRMDAEASLAGFFKSRVCMVKTSSAKPPKRVLLAYKKHPAMLQRQELTIGSAEYHKLTKDFYHEDYHPTN